MKYLRVYAIIALFLVAGFTYKVIRDRGSDSEVAEESDEDYGDGAAQEDHSGAVASDTTEEADDFGDSEPSVGDSIAEDEALEEEVTPSSEDALDSDSAQAEPTEEDPNTYGFSDQDETGAEAGSGEVEDLDTPSEDDGTE